MNRYSHAAELMHTQPPLVKLDFLMTDLGAWAKLNPKLRPLHAEFVTAVRQLHDLSDLAAGITDSARLEQAAAVIAETGKAGEEAAKTLRLHAAYLRDTATATTEGTP